MSLRASRSKRGNGPIRRTDILGAAEEHGLVRRRGQSGLGLIPRGMAALDRFIADTLASQDMTYRMALRAMAPTLRARG